MKNTKLIIFLFAIIILILIFFITYNKSFDYVAIGDGITMGKNNFNKISTGYTDFFKNYLENGKMLKTYNNMYSSEKILLKDIVKEIESNTKRENINQIIVNADILTLSFGTNEFKNMLLENELNYIEKNNYIIEIYNNYKKLIKEIRKLNDCEIYIIGIYNLEGSDYLIKELNNLLKSIEKEKKVYYIDVLYAFKKNSFYLPNGNYPSIEGHNYISNEIIKKFKKNKLYSNY